jgi:hypothetical protein
MVVVNGNFISMLPELAARESVWPFSSIRRRTVLVANGATADMADPAAGSIRSRMTYGCVETQKVEKQRK